MLLLTCFGLVSISLEIFCLARKLTMVSRSQFLLTCKIWYVKFKYASTRYLYSSPMLSQVLRDRLLILSLRLPDTEVYRRAAWM